MTAVHVETICPGGERLVELLRDHTWNTAIRILDEEIRDFRSLMDSLMPKKRHARNSVGRLLNWTAVEKHRADGV